MPSVVFGRPPGVSPAAARPFNLGTVSRPAISAPRPSTPGHGFDPTDVVFEGGFKPVKHSDRNNPPLAFEVGDVAASGSSESRVPSPAGSQTFRPSRPDDGGFSVSLFGGEDGRRPQAVSIPIPVSVVPVVPPAAPAPAQNSPVQESPRPPTAESPSVESRPGQVQSQPEESQFRPEEQRFQPEETQFEPEDPQFRPEEPQFRPGEPTPPGNEEPFRPDRPPFQFDSPPAAFPGDGQRRPPPPPRRRPQRPAPQRGGGFLSGLLSYLGGGRPARRRHQPPHPPRFGNPNRRLELSEPSSSLRVPEHHPDVSVPVPVAHPGGPTVPRLAMPGPPPARPPHGLPSAPRLQPVFESAPFRPSPVDQSEEEEEKGPRDEPVGAFIRVSSAGAAEHGTPARYQQALQQRPRRPGQVYRPYRRTEQHHESRYREPEQPQYSREPHQTEYNRRPEQAEYNRRQTEQAEYNRRQTETELSEETEYSMIRQQAVLAKRSGLVVDQPERPAAYVRRPPAVSTLTSARTQVPAPAPAAVDRATVTPSAPAPAQTQTPDRAPTTTTTRSTNPSSDHNPSPDQDPTADHYPSKDHDPSTDHTPDLGSDLSPDQTPGKGSSCEAAVSPTTKYRGGYETTVDQLLRLNVTVPGKRSVIGKFGHFVPTLLKLRPREVTRKKVRHNKTRNIAFTNYNKSPDVNQIVISRLKRCPSEKTVHVWDIFLLTRPTRNRHHITYWRTFGADCGRQKQFLTTSSQRRAGASHEVSVPLFTNIWAHVKNTHRVNSKSDARVLDSESIATARSKDTRKVKWAYYIGNLVEKTACWVYFLPNLVISFSFSIKW